MWWIKIPKKYFPNKNIWSSCPGNYSCFAENELGKSRGFIELSGENYDDYEDYHDFHGNYDDYEGYHDYHGNYDDFEDYHD